MSISKRFGVTFITNGLKSLVAASTSFYLARKLGPVQFGVFSFLTATFLAYRHLIDWGTSKAFYTFLSKKPQSRFFLASYLFLVIVQFTVTALFFLILPNHLFNSLLQGQARTLSFLAFCAIFIKGHVWTTMLQVAESQRLTIRAQALNLFVTILNLTLVIVLNFLDKLDLIYIFSAILIKYLLILPFAWKFFKLDTIGKEISNSYTIKTLTQDYKAFCTPLVIYTSLSFLFAFSEKWLLQRFSGSHEQAYLGIAQQISTICLFATSSILNILWKEIAEAKQQSNLKLAGELYTKVSNYMLITSSILACSIIPWSKELLFLLLGSEYTSGSITLSVMAFYPIHQTLGQINGTMFVATEDTNTMSKVGIIMMLISIPLTYLAVASSALVIPGLGLGSLGVAIKLLTINLFLVFYQKIIITRKFNLKNNYLFDIYFPICTLALSFIAKILITKLINFNYASGLNIYLQVATGILLYFSFLLISLLLAPSLFRLNRNDLDRLLGKLKVNQP